MTYKNYDAAGALDHVQYLLTFIPGDFRHLLRHPLDAITREDLLEDLDFAVGHLTRVRDFIRFANTHLGGDA